MRDVDTSVLVKLYVREPLSAPVATHLRAANEAIPAPGFTTSSSRTQSG